MSGISAWCHRHGCKAYESREIDERCPECPMHEYPHLLGAKQRPTKHAPPNIFKAQRDARFHRSQRAKRKRD